MARQTNQFCCPAAEISSRSRMYTRPDGLTDEWLMIDALFWYTGLAAWVLIVFAVVSTFAVEAYERSAMKRAGHRDQR